MENVPWFNGRLLPSTGETNTKILKLKLDKKVCWQTLSWLEVVLRAFKGFLV